MPCALSAAVRALRAQEHSGVYTYSSNSIIQRVCCVVLLLLILVLLQQFLLSVLLLLILVLLQQFLLSVSAAVSAVSRNCCIPCCVLNAVHE